MWSNGEHGMVEITGYEVYTVSLEFLSVLTPNYNCVILCSCVSIQGVWLLLRRR